MSNVAKLFIIFLLLLHYVVFNKYYLLPSCWRTDRNLQCHHAVSPRQHGSMFGFGTIPNMNRFLWHRWISKIFADFGKIWYVDFKERCSKSLKIHNGPPSDNGRYTLSSVNSLLLMHRTWDWSETYFGKGISSLCGFRRQRSTIDTIFVARLLQEKCREQHRSLFFAFIDLTKAFDTVNRSLLGTFSVNLAVHLSS